MAELLSTENGELVDPKEVILAVVKASPPKKSEGTVLLRGLGRERKYFENESILFRSIDQTLQAASLQCYAPITLRDESKRQQLEGKVAELITSRVEQLITSPDPSASQQGGRP